METRLNATVYERHWMVPYTIIFYCVDRKYKMDTSTGPTQGKCEDTKEVMRNHTLKKDKQYNSLE